MELNRYIEHTLLRPDATGKDIDRLCEEALKYQFAAVVVNPIWVARACKKLKGGSVKVCSVIGFPLGATPSAIKVLEAGQVVAAGAEEIDVVANLGYLIGGDAGAMMEELSLIRNALPPRLTIKVIIETPVLPPAIWPDAVEAVVTSGAEFVKSATGFFGPTTVEHVCRLSDLAAGRVKIKAAGGLRTAAQSLAMIEAGAARLGCSASIAIMEEYMRTGGM